ncbi:MAG: Holliday junction branch migration DNA helicase RuvB [Methylacidiphilales bacterium]|nr:Holliday junction branch migration DNA helicase RuvB [Candidatus Methylacidiphilales bacterium]
MIDSKIVDTANDPADLSLRPLTLQEYVGQSEMKQQMSIFIKAALLRNSSLDHLLIFGPPGLGKTTLATIVARELNSTIRHTSGPVIEKAADLASLLTNLKPHDVLFIDEIHRLSSHVEEVLYPAMEDFQLDLMIGEGPSARSIKLDLPRFTLIGATTRAGLLSSPLRDRFGIVQRLDYYEEKDIQKIIHRSSNILNISISPEASQRIASCSRGTPRIANRLLRRVHDVTLVRGETSVSLAITEETLHMLHVDTHGLDELDQRFLKTIANIYRGGPVGLETIATTLGEDSGTIENIVEPFLLKRELIVRGPRGRSITPAGYSVIGMQNPNPTTPLL